MDKPALGKKVEIELVNLVLKQMRFGIATEALVFSVVGAVLWSSSFNPTLLFMWWGIVIFFCFVRFGVVAKVSRMSNFETVDLNKIFTTLYILAAIAGLSWSFIGSIFMEMEKPLIQILLVMVLLGAMSVANFIYTPIKYLYLLFIIPGYLPHILWLLFQGNIYTIIGFLATLYGSLMLLTSSYLHQLIKNSVYLRFHNENLAVELIGKSKEIKNTNVKLEKSEELFRKAMDNAPIGMAVIALDGTFLLVNNAICAMLGYTKEELQHYKISDLTYPADIPTSNEFKEKLLQGKVSAYKIEKRYIGKNGDTIWAILYASLVRNKDNYPLHFIVQIEDISARKKSEEQMQTLHTQTTEMLTELQFYSKAMTNISKMNDMLQACVTSNEAYEIIKEAAQETFPKLNGGITVVDTNDNNLKTVEQWGQQPILSSYFFANDCWALREGKDYVVDHPNQTIICRHFITPPIGSYLCMPLIVQSKVIGTLVFHKEDKNIFQEKEKQLLVNFSEVIKLALSNLKLREKLQEQAIRDPLTGLFNRRFLDEVLARELKMALRDNKTFCVAMIDIDFFKKFNDTYGHEAGDEVLKYLGSTLLTLFRDSDFAARFGGEEFILILHDTSLQSARLRLDRLREQITAAQLYYQGKPLDHVSVSIGLAEVPMHGVTQDEIIRAADQALYSAKQSGRDQVYVHA